MYLGGRKHRRQRADDEQTIPDLDWDESTVLLMALERRAVNLIAEIHA